MHSLPACRTLHTQENSLTACYTALPLWEARRTIHLPAGLTPIRLLPHLHTDLTCLGRVHHCLHACHPAWTACTAHHLEDLPLLPARASATTSLGLWEKGTACCLPRYLLPRGIYACLLRWTPAQVLDRCLLHNISPYLRFVPLRYTAGCVGTPLGRRWSHLHLGLHHCRAWRYIHMPAGRPATHLPPPFCLPAIRRSAGHMPAAAITNGGLLPPPMPAYTAGYCLHRTLPVTACHGRTAPARSACHASYSSLHSTSPAVLFYADTAACYRPACRACNTGTAVLGTTIT